MAFCTRGATWRRRIWLWWKGCPTRATCGACAKGFCWTMASRCQPGVRVLEGCRWPPGPRSSSARGPVPSGYRQRHGGKRGRDALARPGILRGSAACAEGRNRQVRRMLDAVGHPVIALHREAFGPLPWGICPGVPPVRSRKRKWRASRSLRPSSGADEGLVWSMFRRLRISEPIRVPARSATRADAGPLSERGSQPAPL